MAVNPYFQLKPGETRQMVKAVDTLHRPTEIIAVMPHMHMLGKEMKMVAKLPDGTEESMVYINDWDFNWQETYRYKKPRIYPQGTKIHLTAFYDNSEQNSRQASHPPKLVGWGEQTTDEMCIGFYQYTVPFKK